MRIDAVLSTNRENIIANLVPPGRTRADWRDPIVRETGYRRANAYLALRCDALVVFFDPARGAGRPAAGPGGTAEMLSWLRDRGGIPTELRLFGDGHDRPSPVVVTVPHMT
jgi:hypothetical protein